MSAQKIDITRIDTTKLPSGLFQKLVNSLKGNFDMRFEFLDYNKEKNLIYCAYYAKLDMSAIYDFQLIRPTPNGLVRKLNTLYEPNIEDVYKRQLSNIGRKAFCSTA